MKFNQTLHSLQTLKDITIAEAVGVFARNDLKLKPLYVERVKSVYDVNVENVDFSNSSTTQYINRYIRVFLFLSKKLNRMGSSRTQFRLLV